VAGNGAPEPSLRSPLLLEVGLTNVVCMGAIYEKGSKRSIGMTPNPDLREWSTLPQGIP